MDTKKYIYYFTCDDTERELCTLESRYLFDEEEHNKLLLSNIKVDPSCSAYIKNRLDVITASDDYISLIDTIQKENICVNDFKVEYLVFDGDTTEYPVRLQKLRDIGCSIEGKSDYYNPTTIYALCNYSGIWYFGTLKKNSFDWQKHNQKPFSYSNSISINIAKALVNMAAKGKTEINLIDACCGVGTIILEACFAGYSIDGCEINWKICRNARKNIAHYDYQADVHRSDIKDISTRYDAAIIDLPYNLVSCATEEDTLYIIKSTSEISNRLIIVSTSDISHLIATVGFKLIDHCYVSKKGKSNFTRRIWVCENEKFEK